MRQPFSINAFLYRAEEGSVRFFLLKRVQHSNSGLPAFWQGVTGGMEEGETFEETAAREEGDNFCFWCKSIELARD